MNETEALHVAHALNHLQEAAKLAAEPNDQAMLLMMIEGLERILQSEAALII
ncbi:hypothetical protein [Novosphingobium cyanobacteriorum]|uniref:DUF2783 domain-containing protein n=1 Tax=Novosphingobium cyanobacteriorum TaxID=3024215 RepID=A0ABT6CF47_9SPHN|nr:hypothetical protein [Novosphingobium cyanobacteriorum]MDF8332531.1 hypothetical protein [Novosphingobium cyanobacteriorum]